MAGRKATPSTIVRYPDHAEVTLTQGQVARIDLEDADLVAPFRWYAAYYPTVKGYYATTNVGGTTMYMHRRILNAPKGLTVDHLNHDTLDNRKSNLALLTIQKNCQNRGKLHARNKTGVRGVSTTTVNGNSYYVAKVAVVKWQPSKEAAEAEAARLRAVLTSPNSGLTGRKGSGGVGFRKGRWVATASRTVLFPHSPDGLEAATQEIAQLRALLKAA